MLACVCLNPSFDRTVSLRSFTAGDVNRVLSARQDVGGKGINVAITARRLGIASCVLGCAGKNGIDAVRHKLDGEQVTHVFLPVDGDVRTNMKIVPQDGTGVTELNEPGAPVNAANQRAFSDLLAEKTVAGQYVVLTGSLPPECPPEYYRDLMLSLPERLFVLDVSGAALMAGLAAVARPLVSLLLTDKWLPCVPFLQICCIDFAFYPIHTANLQAINAMGRSDVFLKLEIIKAVQGESAFPMEVLSELVNNARTRMLDANAQLTELNEEVEESNQRIEAIKADYRRIMEWSEMFDGSDMDVKKMIAGYIIKRVDVYSDYRLHIEFNMSFAQFELGLETEVEYAAQDIVS